MKRQKNCIGRSMNRKGALFQGGTFIKKEKQNKTSKQNFKSSNTFSQRVLTFFITSIVCCMLGSWNFCFLERKKNLIYISQVHLLSWSPRASKHGIDKKKKPVSKILKVAVPSNNVSPPSSSPPMFGSCWVPETFEFSEKKTIFY